MTNEEAIKVLETTKVMILKGSGPELQEASRMAVEALEKQMPKKPKEVVTDDNEYICSLCPVCNSDLHEEKYCAKCGQAIDWSE